MASIQYRLFSRVISILPLKLRINVLFFRRFGRFANLKSPNTFNEKLQVRKLYDRDKLLTVAADKLASKEFVKSIHQGLYIPKTIWVGESVSDIDSLDIKHLPENYVFKANHTSQTIKIIRDGRHLEPIKMKVLANDWLKHDQSGSHGEWAYKNIPRRVFIEEFLDFEGQAPDDYKFFVFHGKVKYVQLDSDRFSDHCRNIFDSDWNDLNINFSHPQKTPSPNRPLFLEDMIEIAESIGKYFDFIRVDLYFYQEKVTFGELTVYPGAGYEKFPDLSYDILFGSHWVQSYS